ncbi:hypothetical protein EJ072_14120 [Mesorhizobium sp. M2A.F.Ca.ET.046.03.2.1]|uniref:hypothetical protein n=1 Tax=Mesorhizobium sp. M2A.F.Ca.ET.046.03.2.1 TaxID=2493674 RepID=UPI000F74F088|nr:hypothetical protein [Mesorhizobium sp. M2A.F.Ca.ET.046.03.2.1]AZO35477.1 hypothetical protein EJ072_14120 [Mesorhizobium sp. M2A.F.Ca.ET.046.03.2.1]
MNAETKCYRKLTSSFALAVGLVYVTSSFSQADSAVDQALSAMAGTLDVQSQPYLHKGQLSGCTLIFDAILQDWSYRQGGFLKISGNVGIMRAGNKLGANLKVVVLEIDPNDPTLGLKPSAPSRAYLVDDDLKTNLATLRGTPASDTPGALFSIFEVSPTLDMVLDGLRANKLTVAFNSKGGDTDIQLPLQLDVQEVKQSGERVRSNKMKSDFANCLTALGNTFK